MTPSFLETNKKKPINVTKYRLERFQNTEQALKGIITILGYKLKLLFPPLIILNEHPFFLPKILHQ